MVLVLFFLIIITLIILFIILVSVFSIQIDIKNLKLYKEENKKKRTNNDYEVLINGYILKKVKIFKYKINNKKIPEKYFQKVRNKIDLSILKDFFSNSFDISNIKIIEIESLSLKLRLGTENVIVTSWIVTISNILIAIVLSKLMTTYNEKKYNYEVKAVYENKNKIDLFLETKIRIKLFSLFKAIKSYSKTKKEINNLKTSNVKISV